MNPENLSRISLTYFIEAGDAIYCVSAEGQFIFVNKRFCKEVEYTEEELLGMYVWELVPTITRTEWYNHFAHLKKTGCLSITTFHRTKSGKMLHVESMHNFLNVDGKEMYVSHSRYPKPGRMDVPSGSFTEFDAIFEAFPDILFKLSNEGIILYFKAGGNAQLFLEPENFIGKKVQDILPEQVGLRFDEHLRKAIAAQSTESFDYYLKIEGEKKWFEARILPLDEENVVTIIRDITLKREAEKEMHRAERLYKILAANLPNGAVFMFDKKLVFTLVDGLALASLGYKKEEIIGKTPDEALPLRIAEIVKPYYNKALEGISNSFELLGNNGRWYLCNILPILNEKQEVEGGMSVTYDIDRLKKTEKELKESEKIYRTLASNIPNGGVFMFDKDLRFYLAEGQALNELGFPKEIIEGKTLQELALPEAFRKRAEKFCKAALEGNTVNFEMRVYNGRTFYCTGIPITNLQQEIEGGMVVAFDITKQKNIEKELSRHIRELKDSEKLYRMLAHNIPNGVLMMFDENLRCTLAEGQILHKFGYTREKMIGRMPDEIFPEDMATELIPQYRAALEGNSISFEMKTRSTGHAYLVSILPVVGLSNSVKGGMMVAFDIDHLKVVEDELQQRIRELSRLNERLNREVEIRKKIEANLQEYTTELKLKNQELEQFAYVASHDLQEPLRMISSFTQLLGRKYKDQLDKEAEEYIAFAIEGSTRMQQLINDLLAYSRIGTRGKDFKTINFEDIINKAIYNLSLTIRETGARINYGPMPVITGDDSQLVQLIQNLISNAIKFRKEGVTPVINITSKEEPTHYLFSVEDNGIGIAMEHKERIFQIFQRLHTREKYPGTGIGLAICKKIVERHNGEIWVEAIPGQGTAFLFTLKR